MTAITSVVLSPFDNVMVRYLLRFVLFLPMTPNQKPETVFKYLQESFSETMVQIPFLAGKLAVRGLDTSKSRPGQLEVRVPTLFDKELAPKLRFKDLTASMDYAELMAAGFPENALDGDVLIPAAFTPTIDQGIDILAAQANFIKGGCLLCLGVHHSVSDALGMLAILKVWAEQCCRLQAQDTTSPQHVISAESLDRELLQNIWLAERDERGEDDQLDTSEELYRLIGLNPMADIPDEPKITAPKLPATKGSGELPVVETGIFYMSKGALSDLKRAASSKSSEPGENHPAISANDALTAFLWRSVMSARFPPGTPDNASHQTAILDTTVDARAQFSSAVPQLYFGNLVLVNTTYMPLATLLSSSTELSQVTVEIRKTLDTITTSRVHSAFALASSIPDYTNLTYPFATFDGAEFCMTSLLNLPLFELEFGDIFANGGRLDGARPPRAEFDAVCRRCAVLPQRPHGGFEILISLLKEEMERLLADKSFAKFAKFCCH